MTYSTLYAVARAVPDGLSAMQADGSAVEYVVGTMKDGSTVCHGQPDASIPKDAAVVYRDGSTPWTWNDVVTAYPELSAVTPHEWAGEPTAANLVLSKFAAYSTMLSAAKISGKL